MWSHTRAFSNGFSNIFSGTVRNADTRIRVNNLAKSFLKSLLAHSIYLLGGRFQLGKLVSTSEIRAIQPDLTAVGDRWKGFNSALHKMSIHSQLNITLIIHNVLDILVVKQYSAVMKTNRYPDRTLHLVDVENLSGGCICSVESVSETASQYMRLFPSSSRNLYVLASSVGNALACGFGWPTSAQKLMRSGENGADLALLEAYKPQEIAFRFPRVVIGSGDGIFTPYAIALRALGCHVIVVTRPESLSRRLSLVANSVVFLTSTSEVIEASCAA